MPPDAEIYEAILPTVIKDKEYLQVFMLNKDVSPETVEDEKEFVLKGFSDDSNKVILIFFNILVIYFNNLSLVVVSDK